MRCDWFSSHSCPVTSRISLAANTEVLSQVRRAPPRPVQTVKLHSVNDRLAASPAVRPDWLSGSSTTVHCHWLATPKADRQLFCLDLGVSRDDHWASNPCTSNLRVRPFSVCVQPSHLDYGPRGGTAR